MSSHFAFQMGEEPSNYNASEHSIFKSGNSQSPTDPSLMRWLEATMLRESATWSCRYSGVQVCMFACLHVIDSCIPRQRSTYGVLTRWNVSRKATEGFHAEKWGLAMSYSKAQHNTAQAIVCTEYNRVQSTCVHYTVATEYVCSHRTKNENHHD